MAAMGIKMVGFALCVHALCASTNSYPWPNLDEGPKTPERFAAAKRLSRFVPCTVCRLVLQGKMAGVSDEEGLEQLLERDFLSDHAGGASALCSMRQLAPRLRSIPLTVKLYADGSASFVVAGEGDNNVSYFEESRIESDMHWISHGISQACSDIFRRDLEWLAGAVSEAYETEKAKAYQKAGGNEETWTYYMQSAVAKACYDSRPCKLQQLEESLETTTRSRDRARASQDPEFRKNASDFWIPKAANFDALVNYYKILGVQEFDSEAKIRNNYKIMSDLRTVILDLAKMMQNSSGIKEGETVLGELSQALRVLTDRVARRQYDRSRDKLDLEVSVGLHSKRKKDKDCFDGYQAMMEIRRDGLDFGQQEL